MTWLQNDRKIVRPQTAYGRFVGELRRGPYLRPGVLPGARPMYFAQNVRKHPCKLVTHSDKVHQSPQERAAKVSPK